MNHKYNGIILINIVLCFFVLFSFPLTMEAKSIMINPSLPLQEQFSIDGATYVIRDDMDLGGKTLLIPQGSTLSFRRGSLFNGTVSGSFTLKRVKRGSLCIGFSNCSISGIVPVYNNGDVTGLLSSCVEGSKLMEDLTIDKSINLRAGIKGNGHSIICSEKTPVAIYINDSRNPITIDGLVLRKRIPTGTINKNYAIYSVNSSYVTIKNSTIDGRLEFVNKTMSDAIENISQGIYIRRSNLLANFSFCPQGWEYGQDHISFFSIKNIIIEDCTIESVNVNRVLKTSAYFPKQDYDYPINCTDGIIFKNNRIIADSEYGKQFWDMFCGTVNANILNNVIKLVGFTRFIENKAYQYKYKSDELLNSIITIKDNNVEMENGNLFQFHANSDGDNFIVTDNYFCLKGSNVNLTTKDRRNCGFQLQGYSSCIINHNTFDWQDDAIGLPLAALHFECKNTVFSNNTIINGSQFKVASTSHLSRRIVPTVCNTIEFSNNIYKGDAFTFQNNPFVVLSDCQIENIIIKNNNGFPVLFLLAERGAHIKELYTDSELEKEVFYRVSSGASLQNSHSIKDLE